MCGICGIATRDPARPVDADTIRRMTDVLVHRGPDGEGTFVAPGIGLGVRRLAIVDLETGDQPIANEDQSTVLEMMKHPRSVVTFSEISNDQDVNYLWSFESNSSSGYSPASKRSPSGLPMLPSTR